MDYSWTIHGYLKSGQWDMFFRNRGVCCWENPRKNWENSSSHVAIAIALLGPWRILVTMPSQKEVEDLAEVVVEKRPTPATQGWGAHEKNHEDQYNSNISKK